MGVWYSNNGNFYGCIYQCLIILTGNCWGTNILWITDEPFSNVFYTSLYTGSMNEGQRVCNLHPSCELKHKQINTRADNTWIQYAQWSHTGANQVLLLMISLKDMSELLYLFFVYLPTHTHMPSHTHPCRLQPQGCNQGNVLANLLCNGNPKGGWVMMHYNKYTQKHTRME